MHLDHVEDVALLHETAAAGLSSAMFDASHLDYADNVTATRISAAQARTTRRQITDAADWVVGETKDETVIYGPGCALCVRADSGLDL